MYKTITDMAYSRSPECPFIIDELAMVDLRSRLDKYEDKNTLLPPDAQTGVRKSIAAALGGRKGLMTEGEIHAIMYPCSVDVERFVDSLCGPLLPLETSSIDELDSESGTMSMDLGTEYDTPSIPSTPSELQSLSKVVGAEVCQEVMGVVRANVFPDRKL